ncbi:MAG: ArsR/SmtB family transcription factor [Flavobacterium sp.]
MGVTKSDLFNETQNELAAFAKVLAHPARIAIIQYLLQSNSCCNYNLVDHLGLAQATISQHLKELKQLDIIQGTVEGVSVNYCINPEKWHEFRDKFAALFDSYEPKDCSPC